MVSGEGERWKTMMKHKSTLSLVILFSSLTLASTNALADNTVEGRSDVGFSSNNGIIQPVDPDEDIDIEPNYPPTAGPLSINYASSIEFGQHKRTLKEQTFYAKPDTVTIVSTQEKKEYPAFVQVTDLRGTGAGWTLSVKQNGGLKNTKGTELVGSELRLSAVKVESQHGMKGNPSLLANKQLLSDDTQPVVKAEKGDGMGTWNIYLGQPKSDKQDIELKVPTKAVTEVGRYTTSLAWFLQDAL